MHECTKINWKPNRKYRIEKRKKKRREKKRKSVTRLDRFCNGRSMRKIINME